MNESNPNHTNPLKITPKNTHYLITAHLYNTYIDLYVIYLYLKPPSNVQERHLQFCLNTHFIKAYLPYMEATENHMILFLFDSKIIKIEHSKKDNEPSMFFGHYSDVPV